MEHYFYKKITYAEALNILNRVQLLCKYYLNFACDFMYSSTENVRFINDSF